MTDKLEYLSVGALSPSPHNRKHLGDIAELGASIREVGVIEPLIVRPAKKGHEIVAGERRWRAAKAVKLDAVPCIVRQLDDDQAIEIMLIENCQRQDAHPVDEANAYRVLLDRGATVAAIAGRVGRSPAHVAQRLKLLDAVPEVLEALEQERILLGVALELAKVPPKLQKQALEYLLAPLRFEEATPTVKMARDRIREEYMLRLADAPFDRSSATLVPSAPPCASCPKRTGNQAELFGDVDSPDLCTDPGCYRTKLDAHWKAAAAEAKQTGRKVMSDAEAKKVFDQWNENPNYNSGYTTLDAKEYVGNRSKTVKSILGKNVETVLARNPHSGRIHELVPKASVQKALKSTAPESTSTSSASSAEKRAAHQQKIRRAAIKRLVELAVEKAPTVALEDVLGLVVRGFAARVWSETQRHVLERRGIAAKDGTEGAITKLARELEPGGDVEGLALELVAWSASPWHGHGGTSETWKDLQSVLGVDFAKLEKDVATELKKKPSAKKASTTAAVKPARRRKAKHA